MKGCALYAGDTDRVNRSIGLSGMERGQATFPYLVAFATVSSDGRHSRAQLLNTFIKRANAARLASSLVASASMLSLPETLLHRFQ